MLIYLQTIETEEDKSKFEDIYREYRGLKYKAWGDHTEPHAYVCSACYLKLSHWAAECSKS